MYTQIEHILPQHIFHMLMRLPENILGNIEEIRIRTQRPVEIISAYQSGFLTKNGHLALDPTEGILITQEDSLRILNIISNYSLYALEEELRKGFITLPGGHRVGMTGKAVLEKGYISHLKDISCFNIRISREKKRVAEYLIPYLWDGQKIKNTLIVSPPLCGKTTILRDLARIFSTGEPSRSLPGFKVGIVDERSEIAGSVNGIPQNDVGPRTDVLDACPKAEGMMMMIRSMSPQIIVVDEIGRQEDAEALLEAINAGVTIMTSAHGIDLNDISRRPILAKILQLGIFERLLVYSRKRGAGTLEGVYDQNQRLITRTHVS